MTVYTALFECSEDCSLVLQVMPRLKVGAHNTELRVAHFTIGGWGRGTVAVYLLGRLFS